MQKPRTKGWSSRRKYKLHRKIKNRKPRYYWVCAMVMDEERNILEVTTMSHKKPEAEEDFWPMYLTFYSKSNGRCGFDFDRQRFFCASRKRKHPNTPSGRSRFLRESWERNHGFAGRQKPLNYKNIESFLKTFEAQKND